MMQSYATSARMQDDRDRNGDSKHRLNPGELKIDLLCRGIRIDDTCNIAKDARPIRNEHWDQADGLEIILPGELGEVWVNVPILEKSVKDSPYLLHYSQGSYRIWDEDRGLNYSLKLAPRPDWYSLETKRGIPMPRIGMLEGTRLIIRLNGRRDAGDEPSPRMRSISDVVETAAIAKKKSGVTLVILRDGCRGPANLAGIFPFVKALKEEVGILVGAQFPPESDLNLYDEAMSVGIDQFIFPIDFYSRNRRRRYAAGGSRDTEPDSVFRAFEYCSRGIGKWIVSGEVIAGVEPVEETLRAIDYFVDCRAIPLVRVFHPARIPDEWIEDLPAPPRFEEILPVFRHVFDACRTCNLPIGMVPNVSYSVIAHPEDTLYLANDPREGSAYHRWLLSMKQVMTPYFLRRMRRLSQN